MTATGLIFGILFLILILIGMVAFLGGKLFAQSLVIERLEEELLLELELRPLKKPAKVGLYLVVFDDGITEHEAYWLGPDRMLPVGGKFMAGPLRLGPRPGNSENG